MSLGKNFEIGITNEDNEFLDRKFTEVKDKGTKFSNAITKGVKTLGKPKKFKKQFKSEGLKF